MSKSRKNDPFLAPAVPVLGAASIDAYVEAERRALARRCYYTVFLVARELLGLNAVRRGVHAKVLKRCGQIPKYGKEIYEPLKKLLNLRKKADYKTWEEFTPEDAKDSITLANEIISLLKDAQSAGFIQRRPPSAPQQQANPAKARHRRSRITAKPPA